jgi:hypothetical protein
MSRYRIIGDEQVYPEASPPYTHHRIYWDDSRPPEAEELGAAYDDALWTYPQTREIDRIDRDGNVHSEPAEFQMRRIRVQRKLGFLPIYMTTHEAVIGFPGEGVE